MQILSHTQGSQEWLQARLGVATASNFAKIITSTGAESKTLETYALELASQKMLVEPEECYKNSAMRRGNELEPVAREVYEQETLEPVQEIGLMISDCGNYGYSSDGLVGDDGLIEIKCPQATTHFEYIVNKKLPTAYKAQVQGGLWVSGRQWCDFVSYHPNFKENKLFIIRVERDEEFIQKLAVLVEKTIKLRDEFFG
jgi:putative phage-type endonuclease